MNTVLTFDIQLVNRTLFLNAKNLFLMSIIPLPFIFVTVTSPLTTIYASLKSGADPGGVDGVASHPPYQMKKNKGSGFSSNFILN